MDTRYRGINPRQALENLSPERLRALRKVATVESVGSSTRIEGAKLTDAQVESLLSNLEKTSFLTRDEQDVAGARLQDPTDARQFR